MTASYMRMTLPTDSPARARVKLPGTKWVDAVKGTWELLQGHYNTAMRVHAKLGMGRLLVRCLERRSKYSDLEVQEFLGILPKITYQQAQIAGQSGEIVVELGVRK